MKTGKICFYCGWVVIGLGAAMAVGADPDWQHTGSPCFGIDPSQIVWCDNFDTYCIGGNTWAGYPPFPAACADGTSTPDDSAYLANWAKPFDCGALWSDKTHIVEELCDWGLNRDYNPPFSLRYEGCFDVDPETGASICSPDEPWDLSSSRHEFSMVDAINDQWPGYGRVGGTNSVTLKMKFHLEHMTQDDDSWWTWHRVGDSANANFYVELCLDDDRAPTNVTWVDCGAAGYGTRANYPVVCQQWQMDLIPKPGFLINCPPLSTTAHSSIAVGLLAIMDANPCDLEHGRRPNNNHIVIFDGLKWWTLMPGIGSPGTYEFDHWGGGDAWIDLEIGGSFIQVEFVRELCCAGTNPREEPCWDGVCTKEQVYNVAVLPRQYLGGFNKIAFGCGEGCELDGAVHTCAGAYDCFKYGAYNDGWGWGHTWMDSLVVYDGVPVESPMPPEVETAVSCKTHGTAGEFCINVLDRTDDDDFEGRRYGTTKLVVNFDRDIQGIGGLDTSDVALSPAGSVDSVSLSASDELTVEMSSTTDGVALIVTFPGIANASDAGAICTDSVCIRQLVGNVRTDGSINAADRVDVRNQVGIPVTSSNFRADVRSADGKINAADRIDVRNVIGNGYGALPYLPEECPGNG